MRLKEERVNELVTLSDNYEHACALLGVTEFDVDVVRKTIEWALTDAINRASVEEGEGKVEETSDVPEGFADDETGEPASQA
jgi:PHD/YefM family antitoxin component YafN of YafNO toxin-antitoxin module